MSPPDVSNEGESSAPEAGVVVSDRARAVRARLATVRDVLVRVFVGDRLGLVVFLGILTFVVFGFATESVWVFAVAPLAWIVSTAVLVIAVDLVL